MVDNIFQYFEKAPGTRISLQVLHSEPWYPLWILQKFYVLKFLSNVLKVFFCGFQRLPNIAYMCDCSIVAHCCSAVFGAWFDCCWEWPRPRHSTLEKNVEVWKFVSVVILLTRKTWHVNTNHGRRKTAREYWMIVVQAIFCFCFNHITS